MKLIKNLEKVSEVCNSTKTVWFLVVLGIAAGLFMTIWSRNLNIEVFVSYSYLAVFALIVIDIVIYILTRVIVDIADIISGFKKESQVDCEG